MTVALSVLAVLGLVGALGGAWDRLRRRRDQPLIFSDADRRRAQATLDYHEKVWDSTVQ